MNRGRKYGKMCYYIRVIRFNRRNWGAGGKGSSGVSLLLKEYEVRRFPYITAKDQIVEVLEEAKMKKCSNLYSSH